MYPWKPYSEWSEGDKKAVAKQVDKLNAANKKNEKERKQNVCSKLGLEENKSNINSEASASTSKSSTNKDNTSQKM